MESDVEKSDANDAKSRKPHSSSSNPLSRAFPRLHHLLNFKIWVFFLFMPMFAHQELTYKTCKLLSSFDLQRYVFYAFGQILLLIFLSLKSHTFPPSQIERGGNFDVEKLASVHKNGARRPFPDSDRESFMVNILSALALSRTISSAPRTESQIKPRVDPAN